MLFAEVLMTITEQEKFMKRTILSMALMAGLSTSAMAADNTWEKEARDAWLDGKAEATLLFNGELDSFNIDTDVQMGKVTLTGKVNNRVEKELAEELVMGIDGVKSVNNQLTVMNELSDMNGDDSADVSAFTDTKIATVVKSRFLFNSEVSGTSIDVDVEDGVVTLNGEVETEAERDLAMSIARNATDVKSVTDMIKIMPKKVDRMN